MLDDFLRCVSLSCDRRWLAAFESLFLGAVIGYAYLDSVLFSSVKREGAEPLNITEAA